MDLDGKMIRDNFESIKNGLKSAVDFLRKELHLYSLNCLPYPAMLVSLVRFFGSEKTNGCSYTDKQRRQLGALSKMKSIYLWNVYFIDSSTLLQ